MSCTSSCLTQDHATWGECMRAKNLRVAYCQSVNGLDKTRQNKWDAELDLFRSAAAQGVLPDTTKTRDIRHALDVSDQTGTAYRADELPK